jgi:membrane fusion protein (multidrug efflux system)
MAQGEPVETDLAPDATKSQQHQTARPHLREVTAPEAKAAEPKPAEPQAAVEKPRRGLRRTLLVLGPVIAVAAGGYFYLTGGRYVATDNAYVKADKLNLATDVSGIVAKIEVREDQKVEKGQILFRLDDEPYRIALAGAQAQLGAVRNEIATLKATYRQNQAQIEQANTDVDFYETSFQRQQDLSRRGVSTQVAFDEAKRNLDLSRERVIVAQRQAEATLAQLGGKPDDPVEAHPRVQQAQAQVDRAKRDLGRTVVTAPNTGVVTNVNALQVGQYLQAAQPAFSLVALDHVWVEANPKETDLTYLKPGDPASVTVDTYPGVQWHATVASVSPATGAEFSVLPPQNASGNWVKVVQRVPIRLNVEVPAGAPSLRSGMSANVEVDTGHTRSLTGVLDGLKHSIGL